MWHENGLARPSGGNLLVAPRILVAFLCVLLTLPTISALPPPPRPAPTVGEPGSGWDLDEALARAPAFQPEHADNSLARAQRANLLFAREAYRILESDASDLNRAVAIAKLRGIAEARLLVGGTLPPREPLAHATPSDAALAFLARHGVEPSVEQAAALRALDAHPPALAAALARSIDAFNLFQQAAAASSASPGSHGAVLLLARNDLVEAAADLQRALAASATIPQEVNIPHLLHVSTGNTHDTYDEGEDYALLIDLGGNDDYLNNAGGASSLCPEHPAAAALLDLSRRPDEDVFNVVRATGAWTENLCGANGGAYGRSGFLFNTGGSDRYGNVSSPYFGPAEGFNGGGDLPGAYGFLLDVGGDDAYVGDGIGVNGGGVNGGSGLLVHTGGSGLFKALAAGTNGGGFLSGTGALVAERGRFNATYLGVNGGGAGDGHGLLVARSGLFEAKGFGSNGGGVYYFGAGAGLLVAGDVEAQDESYGVNGGGAGGAWGSLLARRATLRGNHTGVNGGGADLGVGYVYAGLRLAQARENGTNGGGHNMGHGLLVETGEDTTYLAAIRGANGGSSAGGLGSLVDLGGDDRYVANHTGVNGGGAGGLLFDAGGSDEFQDEDYACLSPPTCTQLDKDGGLLLDV